MEQRKTLIRNAIDTGRPQFALKDLKPLLVAHPQDASLHNLMGITQMALKNFPRAAHHLKIAYRLDPQAQYALNLSSALIESGDYPKALNLLKYSLEKWPRYRYRERLLHNLGYAFVKQKMDTKAEHWLRKALEENPTFYPSHIELARLYARTNRPAMARQAYRSAIDYCETCYEPVEALARSLLRIGRVKQARALLVSFQRVDGIDPEDKRKAQRLLVYAERRLKETRIGTGPRPKRQG